MKRTVLLISLLVLVVVLGGCIPQNILPKGNLKVVVNIPAQLQSLMANAKLATAGFDVSTMKIQLSNGASSQEQVINLTEAQSTVETTFNNLAIGQWTVNVQVLDAQNNLIYQGTGTGSVATNATNTVTVLLDPNKGGVQIQVTFPEDSGVATGEVLLTHALNNTNAPNEASGNLTISGNIGTAQFSNLYPTSWQMYVTLRSATGAVLAQGEDTIEILPGRTISVAVEMTLGGDMLIDVIWDLPPAKPVGLTGQLDPLGVKLTWAANSEPNIAGYRLYRSDSATGAKHLLNIDLVTATEYIDTTAPAGTYWYWVRAVATTGLASFLSDTVSVVVPVVGEEFGQAEGYVRYYDRTDHSGVTVSVAGMSAVTSADGYYYFENVPVGENILLAEAAGYYANSAVFAVQPNMTNPVPELYLYPAEAYGSVSGYAKYLDGTDHSGIAIQIRTLEGAELPNLIAITDASGYFIFPQVPVDSISNTATYIFTAFKLNDFVGYSTDSQEVIVTGNTHTEIPVEFVLRYAAIEVMIFADDVTPWDSNALSDMLTSLNVNYQIYSSSEIPTVDLPLDKIVWIVNDQPQGFYDVYAQYQNKFDQFVYNGGTMLFEACDQGWNGGSILGAGATMPGGVQNNLYFSSINTVVNPTHPMMTGIPVDLSGTYASHNWFSNIPAENTVLAVDDVNNPTLIEYRYNMGRVIATGQPLEFHWNNYQNPMQIYPNMIYYTFHMAIPAPAAVANHCTAVPTRTSSN